MFNLWFITSYFGLLHFWQFSDDHIFVLGFWLIQLEEGFSDGLGKALNVYGKDKDKTKAVDNIQKGVS